jgi:transposase
MTIEKVELTLSNNRCEDYIRPFVLGRKNWLFADSETCAQVSASIYSIVVSAKANNIDVFEYLKDLFTQLHSLMKSNPEPNLSHLLPWNWKYPVQA